MEGKFEPAAPPAGKHHLHLVPHQDSLITAARTNPSDQDFAEAENVRTAKDYQASSDRFGGFEPYVDEFVVGNFLGLEPRRVLELAREGHITSHPLGQTRKTWRFRISEIAADFDRMKKPARAKMPAAVPGTKERNRLG